MWFCAINTVMPRMNFHLGAIPGNHYVFLYEVDGETQFVDRHVVF